MISLAAAEISLRQPHEIRPSLLFVSYFCILGVLHYRVIAFTKRTSLHKAKFLPSQTLKLAIVYTLKEKTTKNLLRSTWTFEATEFASIHYKKFAGVAAQTPATSGPANRAITRI